MSLKINYKNDKFSGMRKYQITTDGTTGLSTLEDKTDYVEIGDVFSADDINLTNKTVNEIEDIVMDIIGTIRLDYLASGWSTQAPYKQTVYNNQIKKTDEPVPMFEYPNINTEQQQKAVDKSVGYITDITTNDGSVTITCDFRKPSADFVLVLKGI